MKPETEMSMSRRWFMCILVYLLAIITFISMFKVQPLFPQLMGIGFTDSTIGLTMSVGGILGVILAFPAGIIFNKIGLKNGLLLAGAFLLAGNLIGIFSTTSTAMLVARAVEGGASALITVAGPTAIAAILPPSKNGTGMGIYSAIFPVGSVLSLLITPNLFNATNNLYSPWILCSVLSAVALTLIIMFFAIPEQAAATDQGSGAAAGRKPDFSNIKPLWIGIFFAALAMAANNAIYSAATSFYPTYLMTDFGMSNTTASAMLSILSLIMAAGGPISGIISDKCDTRKALVVFGLLGTAACSAFAFVGTIEVSWGYIILQGVFGSTIGTGVMALIPRLAKRPDKVPMGMALNGFLCSIGNIVGPAVFGAMQASMGLATAAWTFLVPVAVLVSILNIVFVRDSRNGEGR